MNTPSTRNTSALPLGTARSFIVRSRLSPSAQGVLAALSLLSVIIACIWLANTVAQQVVKETLDEQLSSVARLAAQRIDPAEHARLVDVSQQNGEAYGLVVAPLKMMLVATPEFKFMYTLRVSPEGLRFIVDAADPVDADNDGVIDQSTLGEVYEDPDPAMLATFEARAARVSPAPKTDKWGTFVSAFAPVFAADGTIECIVGVDSTAENYLARLTRIDRSSMLAGALGTLASAGLGMIVFAFERRRRSLDATLAANESRYRALVEGADVIVWQYDTAKEVFTYVSPQAAGLGYPIDEWYRKGFWAEHIHSEDVQLAKGFCKTETLAGRDNRFQYRMIAADGRVVWIENFVSVDRTTNACPILRGVMIDITDRKEAETELQSVALKLEEAQAVAGMGSWSFDLATGKVCWSKQVYKLFGRNEADGPPDYASMLSDYDTQSGLTLDAAVQKAIGGGMPYTILLRTSKPQMGVRFVRGEGRVRRDASGKIIGLFGTATDVTADIDRQETLRVARHQAELASRAKSEFLANMSHEIRTPLTAILGFTDLLAEDASTTTPEQRAQTIGTIKQAGTHLLTVINDILDLSKIEADKMTIDRIDTSLVAVLHEIESLMRPRAATKGVRLNAVLVTPVPEHVMSDPTRLRQILMNLAGNAAKFTESGSVTIGARVEACDGHDRLIVDVADTGPGMTGEQAERLFVAFGQADGTVTRKHGGTGLGLTISRRLAKMMGGDVTLLHSEVERGSTFRLDLPLEAVAGTRMIARMETVQETTPSVAASPTTALRGRILLAEDGPDNQRLIAHHLRKAGAAVDVADNGRIALEMIDKAAAAGTPYGLLLTDMQMPEMDGYTLAARLRRRGSRLAIVALTAHAMAEDRLKCIEAGCDDYASKPIDRTALLTTCAAWLGKASANGASAPAA